MEGDMAAVLVLLGGILGFASGTAALIFTDLGFWAAMGIWVAVGLTASLSAIAVALLPHARHAAPAKDAHA
jgi:hypothetical protein